MTGCFRGFSGFFYIPGTCLLCVMASGICHTVDVTLFLLNTASKWYTCETTNIQNNKKPYLCLYLTGHSNIEQAGPYKFRDLECYIWFNILFIMQWYSYVSRFHILLYRLSIQTFVFVWSVCICGLYSNTLMSEWWVFACSYLIYYAKPIPICGHSLLVCTIKGLFKDMSSSAV